MKKLTQSIEIAIYTGTLMIAIEEVNDDYKRKRTWSQSKSLFLDRLKVQLPLNFVLYKIPMKRALFLRLFSLVIAPLSRPKVYALPPN